MQVRLACTPTFSTASGNFFVNLTGLPSCVSGNAGAEPLALSRWNGFTLDAGYTSMGAEQTGSAAQIAFFESGSTKAGQQIAAGNLVSGTAMRVDFSGKCTATQP